MTRNTYRINFTYHFDPTDAHKGAHYSIDGEHWMNAGEFAEVADKLVRGLGSSKDANTAFDRGSDIPQTRTSVKSGKATVTTVRLGPDFESFKRAYFARVHSTNWDYVVIIDDTVTVYNMNAAEFEAFLDKWASFQKDRGAIRIKQTSTKMLQWLDQRV